MYSKKFPSSLQRNRRNNSIVTFAVVTQSRHNLLSTWKKAQIIAEVCSLDKWTALRQGQGAGGVLFHLSKSFEKTKGKKEESHSTLLSVAGASCWLSLASAELEVWWWREKNLSFCPANHTLPHTQNTFFFPQVELFLSGAREDFRGQSGSKQTVWNFLEWEHPASFASHLSSTDTKSKCVTYPDTLRH